MDRCKIRRLRRILKIKADNLLLTQLTITNPWTLNCLKVRPQKNVSFLKWHNYLQVTMGNGINQNVLSVVAFNYTYKLHLFSPQSPFFVPQALTYNVNLGIKTEYNFYCGTENNILGNKNWSFSQLPVTSTEIGTIIHSPENNCTI